MPKIRQLLKEIVSSKIPAIKAVEMLQTVSGVGRNLSTKLLAMHQPEKLVVVNEPVERALRAFGYEMEMDTGITGSEYGRFLKELTEFIDECDVMNLRAAAALDAFFYAYSNNMLMAADEGA